MYDLTIFIIIIILFISIQWNTQQINKSLYDFTYFASNKFIKQYKTHGITLNTSDGTLTKNGKSVKYINYFNSLEAKLLTDDKIKTKKLWDLNNIPTPKYYEWNKKKSFLQNIENFKKKSLKFPLVVKPIYGRQGDGVFMHISTIDKLIKIITKLLKLGKYPMIEEQKYGSVYRILLFNNNIVGIYKKEPAYVIGNDVHTLDKLIQDLIIMKKNAGGHVVKIIDWKYIKNQGYEKNNVIPKNTKVILSSVANLHNGAIITPVNIKDVAFENIQMFKRLNKISDLNLNGIDYISYNLKVPYSEYGYVLENNAKPGINGHSMTNPEFLSTFVQSIKFQ
jgi:cyanophycin synthetase